MRTPLRRPTTKPSTYTVDMLYAGIAPDDRCEMCLCAANDHVIKFKATRTFSIKCDCRKCTTFQPRIPPRKVTR